MVHINQCWIDVAYEIVCLFDILYEMYYLVVLNVLFEMNSPINFKGLSQEVNSLSETP